MFLDVIYPMSGFSWCFRLLTAMNFPSWTSVCMKKNILQYICNASTAFQYLQKLHCQLFVKFTLVCLNSCQPFNFTMRKGLIASSGCKYMCSYLNIALKFVSLNTPHSLYFGPLGKVDSADSERQGPLVLSRVDSEQTLLKLKCRVVLPFI